MNVSKPAAKIATSSRAVKTAGSAGMIPYMHQDDGTQRVLFQVTHGVEIETALEQAHSPTPARAATTYQPPSGGFFVPGGINRFR